MITSLSGEIMKLYRDYIFDLYGTLVDIRTNEEQHALWNKMSLFYGYHGANYPPQALHKEYLSKVSAREKDAKQVHYSHEAYPEIPIEEVFAELYTAKGIQPSSELVLHTGQLFRVLSTSHIRLYAGAVELLQKLKRDGKRVFLLSNAQRIFTEYELEYLGIADCFDGIMISSEYGVKKPDERFFALLINQYGIDMEHALMIGNDLDSDIAGAKRAGLDTFYIHSAISPKLNRTVDADYSMMHMDLRKLYRLLSV